MQYAGDNPGTQVEGTPPAVGKQDDSLPVESRGAKQQLTELLAKWQRQARGLVAVNNIARAVVSSQGLDEILATAVDEIQESLGVGRVQFILLDPDTGQLVYHGRGRMKATRPDSDESKGLEKVVLDVIQNAESRRLDGVALAEAGQLPHPTSCAALCVPLLACDRVVGAIQVMNNVQHRAAGRTAAFDEHDQEVLEGVAAFLAMAVENARLQEATRAQAAAQALQETVVTLAHYVNNPLQGMVAAAELLKERLAAAPQVAAAGRAGENSAEELLEIIIGNAQAISAVLRLLQDVSLPESVTYVGSQQMLDIERELQARIQALVV